MANTANTSRTTSLTGRVAAAKSSALDTKQASDKKKAAAQQSAKTKAGCAWTIAKTMLPSAPHAEQVKFASTLMAGSETALKAAVRQTAVNAHFTRVAEQIQDVHKVDINDLMEKDSVLTKEWSAVKSEFKGDPKNAGAKKADDRTEAGPLPATYPEPKRDEPTELDGGHAAERPAMKEKESAAAPKKAHGADCKGCENCDKEKKAAAAKAAAAKLAHSKECKGCDECDKEKIAAIKAAAAKRAAKKVAEGEEAPAEEPFAEDAAPAEDAPIEGDELPAVDDIPPAEDAPAEGDAAAEPFDEELANLEDAVDDVKADIDTLEDAVSEFTANPEDISFEGEGGEDEFPNDEFDAALFGDEDGAEALPEEGGEELNLNDIFDEGAMADKVSALNDEDVITIAENDGDDFFAPSDPSELESVLEQEEGLTSPADMFSLDGVDNDPMARMFASKQAADDIVEPGSLDSFFETELKGDDRDNETDHDQDIFAEILNDLKQPTRDDKRDTEPNLKDGPVKEPGAKASSKVVAPVRKIRQAAATPKEAAAGGSLASLLFTDEADYR